MGKLLGALPLGQLLLAPLRHPGDPPPAAGLRHAARRSTSPPRVWRLTVAPHAAARRLARRLLRRAPLPADGRDGGDLLRHAVHPAPPRPLHAGERGRPAPPRRLRGRLRRHAHGGPAELRRGRRARRSCRSLVAVLFSFFMLITRAHRPRHRPGGAAGRERPRRHRHPRAARPPRRRPRLARARPVAVSGADWLLLLAPRRLRHRRAPRHHLRAALRAFERRSRRCSTSSSPSPP